MTSAWDPFSELHDNQGIDSLKDSPHYQGLDDDQKKFWDNSMGGPYSQEYLNKLNEKDARLPEEELPPDYGAKTSELRLNPIPFNLAAGMAGFDESFKDEIGLDNYATYRLNGAPYADLSAQELLNIGDNVNKTWDMYKEKQLTELRGRLSKELAQYDAARSFRENIRTPLTAISQGFWS